MITATTTTPQERLDLLTKIWNDFELHPATETTFRDMQLVWDEMMEICHQYRLPFGPVKQYYYGQYNG